MPANWRVFYFSFPFSFKNSEDARRYLVDLGSALGDLPKFVEFRHDSWIHPAIFRFLGEAGLSFVCVDQPQLKGLLPPVCKATSEWAYVRFHGRNAASWWNHKEAYERYDYLYTEAELEEWVPRILELARHREKVFISMNNHYQAKAVINARMLRGDAQGTLSRNLLGIRREALRKLLPGGAVGGQKAGIRTAQNGSSARSRVRRCCPQVRMGGRNDQAGRVDGQGNDQAGREGIA